MAGANKIVHPGVPPFTPPVASNYILYYPELLPQGRVNATPLAPIVLAPAVTVGEGKPLFPLPPLCSGWIVAQLNEMNEVRRQGVIQREVQDV